jgi:hypothetical protein
LEPSSVIDRLGRLQDTFEYVTLLLQAFGVHLARPAATADAIFCGLLKKEETHYYDYKYRLEWRSPHTAGCAAK